MKTMLFQSYFIVLVTFILSCVMAIENVQNYQDADEYSQQNDYNNPDVVTRIPTKLSTIRSLWKSWVSFSSLSSSQSKSKPLRKTTSISTDASSSHRRTDDTDNNINDSNQAKCTLCHDGSFPKNPNHRVEIMFTSFSFDGTCQQLYYNIQTILKSHQICHPIQDEFDWTCGCNMNYIENDIGDGTLGYWDW